MFRPPYCPNLNGFRTKAEGAMMEMATVAIKSGPLCVPLAVYALFFNIPQMGSKSCRTVAIWSMSANAGKVFSEAQEWECYMERHQP